ncbi:MAG: T9SS type A sorting domain-containing protein [Bacteroidota bacterium]
MKHLAPTLLGCLLAAGLHAQCPDSLIISTGFDQTATPNVHLSTGSPDNDWVLGQAPVAAYPVTIGSSAFVTFKDPSYHWAGPESGYINYQPQPASPNNWYDDKRPFVYLNGFSVCGSAAQQHNVTIRLRLHSDNWAEVWLLDGLGNTVAPLTGPLVNQPHQIITANFRDPVDRSTIPVSLNGGPYMLALLQRNQNGPTAVSLDGSVSANNGVRSWHTWPSVHQPPRLVGVFHGSTVTTDPGTTTGGPCGQGPHVLPPCHLPGNPKTSLDSTAYLAADAPATWRLHPNPATEFVTLEGLPPASQVMLLDLQGRTIFNRQLTGRTTIDLRDFEPGIYLLRVTDPQGQRSVQKLLVE